uniref:ATP-grasp domain-containing protein n=1 Tax=viral metagenome TaxID=1070528 RepID=A0A6C0J8F7_9ZZZZ
MLEPHNYLKKQNKEKLFPLNDQEAWLRNPIHKIIYNKLWLSEIQNLPANPTPIIPSEFPVIVKPIINLDGMSKGFLKVNNKREYNKISDLPGYFYQTYLNGLQYNYDIIMKNGRIIDSFCLESMPLNMGMFKYHKHIEKEIPANIKILLESFLDDYTGFLNIEVIDKYIIEAHLRLNGDFFIYKESDLDKLILFIETNKYKKLNIKKNISFFPLFLKDKNVDFKSIEYLLKDTIVENYKFDDIYSTSQNEINKRFLYFTCYNYNKGLELQNKIYSILYINVL